MAESQPQRVFSGGRAYVVSDVRRLRRTTWTYVVSDVRLRYVVSDVRLWRTSSQTYASGVRRLKRTSRASRCFRGPRWLTDSRKDPFAPTHTPKVHFGEEYSEGSLRAKAATESATIKSSCTSCTVSFGRQASRSICP